MPRSITAAALLAILLGSSACSRDPAAALADSESPSYPAPAAAPAPTATPTRTARAATAAGLPDFATLVERYGRAVVNVEVVGSREIPTARTPGDDELLDFFRRFGGAPGDAESGDTLLMRGAGSGFIVSKDGYILTNAHVVAEADEVTVRLTDRREFPAKVVGVDKRTDVAVLKIDARDLPVVRIGSQRELRTGEWVLAIGSPFGLENTATAGIVSGTSRAVSAETAVPFIQTDVAVNPGNSGGPLFNLDGEVVGMNSMIFSQSGGYMGISFAIPIELAMDVREQLIKTGHVVRGRIGVGVQDLDASLARSFKLDRPRGALVSLVEKNGPAAKAGVKPGDVILAVSGRPVERSADLSNVISRVKPGQEATLELWRGGKSQKVEVDVVKAEEESGPIAADSKPRADGAEEGRRLGLVVRPLTREEKSTVGTDGNVVVEEVAGNAARAGVQPGDIILGLNNKPVRSVADLRTAAERLREGEAAALLVERGGSQVFVPVRVPG
jgi:serine protease Do